MNINRKNSTTTEKEPLISVIVPVYNEEKTISQIINKIYNVALKKQIIAVNDGSTDSTREKLKVIEEIDVVYHQEKNLGKGAAIRKGLEFVKGDIVIIQDADLELDPGEYPKLIEPILNLKTSVVYGSRFLNPKNKPLFLSGLANKFLSLLTSVLYFRRITDMETCYKVFSSSLINDLKLESDRFDIEPELTSKFLKMGIKIIEVPVSYSPRKTEAGKKINYKDGFKAIWTLIKYRFRKLS